MGILDIFNASKIRKADMLFFNLFKSKPYDMDTLEGINSIPVPAKNYNTGDPKKDCIYYVLQRKATEHKKNGNLDLAIACLKKSNELSDYEKHPTLMPKDYFRLVKFLESAERYEEASKEADFIFKNHPEFLDKRISNLPRIKDSIKKYKSWNNDIVKIDTNKICPICSKYNNMIFSISGKSKKFPKLPKEITADGGFCPDCYLGLCLYIDGISAPPKQ